MDNLLLTSILLNLFYIIVGIVFGIYLYRHDRVPIKYKRPLLFYQIMSGIIMFLISSCSDIYFNVDLFNYLAQVMFIFWLIGNVIFGVKIHKDIDKSSKSEL